MTSRIGFISLLVVCSVMALSAQPQESTVYASVISTKLFVVGAANPLTGLFYQKSSEDTVWHHTGPPNIRANGMAVFQGSKGRLLYVASGNGLHKTSDGGSFWRITTGWKITEVWSVWVDPKNESNVYIGTAYGVYKSADGCESWKQVYKGFISSVIVDHSNSAVLYCTTEEGVFKSTDSGESWKRTGLSIGRIRTISQHPKNSNTLFVGTEYHGMYTTTDGGRIWTKIEAGIDHPTFYTIAIDPGEPRTMYAAGYATGVYKSTDGGYSWKRNSKGLDVENIRSIAVDPADNKRVYAGTLGNGVYRSDNAGETWRWVGLQGSQVGRIVIEPQ
jgi:photosystem II stability/assembly factor-like uncharacterized protein